MQEIHIIVLFVCSILLLAIYFIAKIHTRQNVYKKVNRIILRHLWFDLKNIFGRYLGTSKWNGI